uniref:Uncharacterized protein n=1 Tax=Anopheles quadriannulatus TaxID=34691 RepID=A0A182XU53_ANOQN
MVEYGYLRVRESVSNVVLLSVVYTFKLMCTDHGPILRAHR